MKASAAFSLLAGLLLAIAHYPAGAVGLGVLAVESAAGEPLRARIPLVDLGDLVPGDLQIAITSVTGNEPDGAGGDELLAVIDLQTQSAADGDFVLLRSEQPLPATSATLTIETTWSGGRNLSRHLLLIAEPEAPQPESGGAPDAPTPAGETGSEGPQSIRTVAGDSLWRIAASLVGENTSLLNETMLALQRMNPAAFINGDSNRLRADVELRLPEFSADGTAVILAADDAQPLATPASGGQAPDDGPDSRLSLVVADEPGARGAAELDQRIAELEDQLATAQEEVDRVRMDQAELRARLDDLDEQLFMARQIIELRQLELAQLRESLAAQAEQQARLAAQQAAAADAAETAAAAEAAAETMVGAEDLISLLENPWYLAIAIAALALALALILARRGRRDADDAEPLDALVEAADGGEIAPGGQTVAEPDRRPEAEAAVEADPEAAAGEAAAQPAVAEESAAEKADAQAADAGNGHGQAEDSGGGETPAPALEEAIAAGADEGGEEAIAEQLNLAYSFHKMGETERARAILQKLIRDGNEEHVGEARRLLAIIDDSG